MTAEVPRRTPTFYTVGRSWGRVPGIGKPPGRVPRNAPPPRPTLAAAQIFRSGQPEERNFPFIETLRLRTVIFLSPDPPSHALYACGGVDPRIPAKKRSI